VVDDLTVKITLQFPDASFPMIVASPFHAILDSKTVIEQGGSADEDAATADQATPWLDQHSAGTGPFILTGWIPNNEITLEANPNYWGGKPEIDQLTFKHVLDPTAGFQMVQQGDLDILLRLNPDLVEQAKADPNLRVERLSNLDTFYWLMTCDPELSEPLSDQRVRQAMALAVDREGIVQGALNGYGVLPPSILPIGLGGVDPADRLPRDLDRARELLAEAGYEDGFEVTLTYPTSAVWDIVAAKVQSDMGEIGITVQLEPMDFGILLTRAFEDRDVAWWMSDWIPDYADASNWTGFFTFPDEGLFPWTLRCENAVPEQLIELADTIQSETDPEARLTAIRDWQLEMMDFAYAWNLYQINEHVAMNKNVQGFAYIPMGYTYWGELSVAGGE
jgi:peptide/nickel transport system substrate-binding protein